MLFLISCTSSIYILELNLLIVSIAVLSNGESTKNRLPLLCRIRVRKLVKAIRILHHAEHVANEEEDAESEESSDGCVWFCWKRCRLCWNHLAIQTDLLQSDNQALSSIIPSLHDLECHLPQNKTPNVLTASILRASIIASSLFCSQHQGTSIRYQQQHVSVTRRTAQYLCCPTKLLCCAHLSHISSKRVAIVEYLKH